MPFIPHTKDDIEQMLAHIGVDNIQQLFDEIPQDLLVSNLDNIPPRLDEMAVGKLMQQLQNQDGYDLNFIGAGAYEHHIPAAVWQIAARGEFYSSYTPYQAEASQGTLQLIYEYQTMMANLTAMDVSNASLYDGASAMAEAVLMAVRANRKSKSKRILVLDSINPLYQQATHSIVHNQDIELVKLNFDPQSATLDFAELEKYAGEDIAAVVVQQPNFFGALEDVNQICDWAHANNALLIGVCNPLALTLIAPPGEWGSKGADIACGDGQPLGAPLSSGGPYYGYMCTKKQFIRQMPGRIVGKTEDKNAKRGFVLTLQAREQHIRRSKATSNICTNQGLLVTASTIHMAIMGAQGLGKQAGLSYQNTHQLAAMVCKIDGVSLAFDNDYFYETAIALPVPAKDVLAAMAAKGILAGVDLSTWYPKLNNCILICATETKTSADLERYQQQLQATIAELAAQGVSKC